MFNMKLFLVSSTMLVLLTTILEKAQCFSSEDISASMRVPMYLVASNFEGKDQATASASKYLSLLLHEYATSGEIHNIRSALLESITATNVALFFLWMHVFYSRKNKNKGRGENVKDDSSSAACAAEESSIDHEYIYDQPKRRRRHYDDENALIDDWAKGISSIPVSVGTKTTRSRGTKRFPKNRRHIIKYVPNLVCIQEGFDEDVSVFSSC